MKVNIHLVLNVLLIAIKCLKFKINSKVIVETRLFIFVNLFATCSTSFRWSGIGSLGKMGTTDLPGYGTMALVTI